MHTFICAALLLNMTLNCGDPPLLQASAFGVVFGLDFDLALAFAVEVLVVVVFFVAPVAMLPAMA